MTYSIELSKDLLNVMVCYTRNKRIIGSNGTIPWIGRVRGDMKFLSKTTTVGNVALIMGCKTFLSIGRPLPKRINVVLSSKMEERKGIIIKRSLEDAISYCRENNHIIVIFGGENVYRDALNYKCKILATIIDSDDFEGDTFFPNVDCKYECVNQQIRPVIEDCDSLCYDGQSFIENNIRYSFYVGYN